MVNIASIVIQWINLFRAIYHHLDDLVLQAVGRTPNGKKIAADKAGVAVTDRGFIAVDSQMRTNVPNIFAIGGIVGTHAGDMIGEIALAIEMGADAVDIGKTIHPHPTLGESIGMAAEVAHGSCTDLPPMRK
jgi:pyruvate/2-oxoglutarate dehydrogenase complex dihydrolipoamide dehydrogenase (E3) component